MDFCKRDPCILGPIKTDHQPLCLFHDFDFMARTGLETATPTELRATFQPSSLKSPAYAQLGPHLHQLLIPSFAKLGHVTIEAPNERAGHLLRHTSSQSVALVPSKWTG